MPKQRSLSCLQICLRSSQEVVCTSELAGRSTVWFQWKVIMTAQKAPTGLSVKMQLLILGGEAQGSNKHEGSLCQRDHSHLQCGWATFGQILKIILRNCPLHLCICAKIAGTQDLNSSMGRENTPVLCALTICLALWQHAMIFVYVISLLDRLVYSFPSLCLNNVNPFSLPHPWMIPWEDSSTFSNAWWSHFLRIKKYTWISLSSKSKLLLPSLGLICKFCKAPQG